MPFLQHQCRFYGDDVYEIAANPNANNEYEEEEILIPNRGHCWSEERDYLIPEALQEQTESCTHFRYCDQWNFVDEYGEYSICDSQREAHRPYRGIDYCPREFCDQCSRPFGVGICNHDPRQLQMERMRQTREWNAPRFMVENAPRTLQTVRDLRIGVEIEVSEPEQAMCFEALRDSQFGEVVMLGYGAHHEIGNAVRNGVDYWHVTTDATVPSGAEIVSPPLTPDRVHEIGKVMKILRNAGAKVNWRCGTHVHFDAAPLGSLWVAEYVETSHALRQAIDGFVSPSRRTDNPNREETKYCRTWEDHEMPQLEPLKRGILDMPFSRYKTVNPHALTAHGTVENRQHGGTLSGEKIEAWIELQRSIILAAGREDFASRACHEPEYLIRALRSGFGLENAQAGFLSERAQDLGTNR